MQDVIELGNFTVRANEVWFRVDFWERDHGGGGRDAQCPTLLYSWQTSNIIKISFKYINTMWKIVQFHYHSCWKWTFDPCKIDVRYPKVPSLKLYSKWYTIVEFGFVLYSRPTAGLFSFISLRYKSAQSVLYSPEFIHSYFLVKKHISLLFMMYPAINIVFFATSKMYVSKIEHI